MKFSSKLALLAATALIGLAGVASAQETYAVQKYEFNKEAGVETHGLSFGLTGSYASGFAYDLGLKAADTNGVGAVGGDIELGYTFGGIAGPIAVYEFDKTGGVKSDQFLLGLKGGTDLSGVKVTGKALVDTKDSDTYRLAVGADYALSNDLSFGGELTHFANAAAANSNLIEVGMKMKLVGNAYADVGAHYERENGGADSSGVHLGLGFKF